MDKIPSFTINHEKLLRGVYVSRCDYTPGGDCLTTFDVRLTEPNRMKPVSPEALHTIEHLAATFLRNNPEWKDKIVYWGPMGCCTGNYLIVQGKWEPEDILPLLKETFNFISNFEGDIPGATSKDCGNYLFNNLPEAKSVARTFLKDVLEVASIKNLRYPENQ